jgi:hypothetical protein
MSIAVDISVEKDTATPWLRELQGKLTSHRIAAEVGPRCTRLVQRHLRGLGQNKRGWQSTHFYGRAAEATNWQEGFGFLNIVINQIGMRQRYFGGDIKPLNAGGALTIPASPEAYGKRAGEFSNLQFKFALDPERGVMRPALVEKAGVMHIKLGRKKKDGTKTATADRMSTGLVALFWLSKGVHQEPDPGVLPSDEDFEREFSLSVKALLGN